MMNYHHKVVTGAMTYLAMHPINFVRAVGNAENCNASHVDLIPMC
jgi:hypothetical protein